VFLNGTTDVRRVKPNQYFKDGYFQMKKIARVRSFEFKGVEFDAFKILAQNRSIKKLK